jgi:hypothetical protein
MMYNQKLAAAIKVNGKVLREFNKDTVYITYGSEYSVLIKNLNTVRVIANVYVDGENAVPGGLVVDPGQEIDLERWVKNGNLTEGNRFKFIERTGKIEQHRGAKLEDGLIRIEYKFERVYPAFNNVYWSSTFGNYPPGLREVWCSANSLDDQVYSKGVMRSMAVNSVPVSNNVQPTVGEVGITVPGSKSEQTFQTVSNFNTESESYSMVFKLLGETEANRVVREPVTVKAKPKCQSCGKQNKAIAKFCSECGTALEIFA